ncbi:hypothetical protein SYK_28020 [Pseudodesulfovibrio nedwellii]|uniref:Uncharacterized protein n=1 Tax=Pseudodesulfovibrio nedwellii TaxID=2973072 RepID=A0ABN6S5C9_9BACT|nr:hypothetical protein SYK_28020 [Pseudodesulfovibrio nedwellii]
MIKVMTMSLDSAKQLMTAAVPTNKIPNSGTTFPARHAITKYMIENITPTPVPTNIV